MMSAFFHFQHTLKRLFNNSRAVKFIPPEKTTLKNSSLIRVNEVVLPEASKLNAICYHTDKQTSKSTHNTILQYLRDSDHNDDNNINYKNYLHRGLCTSCWKMTHKENLYQSQNHF